MSFETSIYIGTVNYSKHYRTDESVLYFEGDYNRQVVDVYLFSSKDAVENRFGCSPSAYINDMLGVYA